MSRVGCVSLCVAEYSWVAIFWNEYAKDPFPESNEKVLEDMLERYRNLEREMVVWKLVGRPDLFPDNEDDERLLRPPRISTFGSAI